MTPQHYITAKSPLRHIFSLHVSLIPNLMNCFHIMYVICIVSLPAVVFTCYSIVKQPGWKSTTKSNKHKLLFIMNVKWCSDLLTRWRGGHLWSRHTVQLYCDPRLYEHTAENCYDCSSTQEQGWSHLWCTSKNQQSVNSSIKTWVLRHCLLATQCSKKCHKKTLPLPDSLFNCIFISIFHINKFCVRQMKTRQNKA